MVTGLTAPFDSGYPDCYIDASSDTSGTLVGTGVGSYGDTQGYSFTNAGSVSELIPGWYGQPDVVVAAYAGRFYYTPPSSPNPGYLNGSSWSVSCSPSSIWVSSDSANYTYPDSYGDDWHLNFAWMAIAKSVSPGTQISCSVTLCRKTSYETTGGGVPSTVTCSSPPGSFSLEVFGA